MKELAYHILDVAKNSVSAGAKTVEITVFANTRTDNLVIGINDDGKGMDADFLRRVTDPFTTTRTTRRVGLGLPLLKDACELTGGTFRIDSTPGIGTRLSAEFGLSSIDRMPMGDIAGALAVLIQGNPDVRYVFRADTDGESYELDTDELKTVLGDVSLAEPDVLEWISENVREGMSGLPVAM